MRVGPMRSPPPQASDAGALLMSQTAAAAASAESRCNCGSSSSGGAAATSSSSSAAFLAPSTPGKCRMQHGALVVNGIAQSDRRHHLRDHDGSHGDEDGAEPQRQQETGESVSCGESTQARMGISSSASSRASSNEYNAATSIPLVGTASERNHKTGSDGASMHKLEKDSSSVAKHVNVNKPPAQVSVTVEKRRHHNKSAPPLHCSNTSGSAGAEEIPRSTEDRCRVSRAIAIHWMSQLMRDPPEPARMAVYRATMEKQKAVQRITASSSCTSSVNGEVHESNTPLAASTTIAGHTTTPKHSFLAAVLSNTKAKGTPVLQPADCDRVRTHALSSSSATPSVLTSPALAAASGTSLVPCMSGENTAVSSPSASPKYDYHTVELMPNDTESVPSLLHALREVSLSCVSLDALSKVSSTATSPTEDGSGGVNGANNGRRRGDGSSSGAAGDGAVKKANTNSKCNSSSPSSFSSVALKVEGTIAANPSGGLNGTSNHNNNAKRNVHEVQWRQVRTHFQQILAVIQNSHEYSQALDAALGSLWREPEEEGEEEVPPSVKQSPSTSGGGSNNCTTTQAPDERSSGGSPAPPDSSSNTQEAGTNDEDGNTHSHNDNNSKDGAANPVVPSTHVRTNSLVSTSTLNCNAAPFQVSAARMASSALIGGIGSLSTSSEAADPKAFSFSLGRQMSSNTPPYSPSQHVASFLERNSPPPHVQEAPMSVFPSTPLGSSCGALLGGSTALMDGTGEGTPSPSTYVGSSSYAGHPINGSTHGAAVGGGGAHNNGSNRPLSGPNSAAFPSSISFHLESREDMLKRRNAAPTAFYATASHSHAHYSPGAGGPNASTTSSGLGSSSAAGSPNGLMPPPPNGLSTGVYTPLRAAQHSLPVSPLLSYSSPASVPQCPYDYILVLDFEATCEQHTPPGYLYEIIEFPVVLVDTRLQRVMAEFHRFVKPRMKPHLSEFCRSLTGIHQEDIDSAQPLEDVIRQFERWYAHTIPQNARAVFATDGPMDFREFMYVHSVARQGIRFPPIFYQFIDVKQTFASFFNCQQGKIKAMLDVLNCPLKGRLHSGLDDARNIATIVIGLLQWGCTLYDIPLNRLPLNSPGTGIVASGIYLPPSTASASSPLSLGSSLPVSKAPPTIDEDYVRGM